MILLLGWVARPVSGAGPDPLPGRFQFGSQELKDVVERIRGGTPQPADMAIASLRYNEINMMGERGGGETGIDRNAYQAFMEKFIEANNRRVREAAAEGGGAAIDQSLKDPSDTTFEAGTDTDAVVKAPEGQRLTLEKLEAMDKAYRERCMRDLEALRQPPYDVDLDQLNFNELFDTDLMPDPKADPEVFKQRNEILTGLGRDVYLNPAAVELELSKDPTPGSLAAYGDDTARLMTKKKAEIAAAAAEIARLEKQEATGDVRSRIAYLEQKIIDKGTKIAKYLDKSRQHTQALFAKPGIELPAFQETEFEKVIADLYKHRTPGSPEAAAELRRKALLLGGLVDAHMQRHAEYLADTVARTGDASPETARNLVAMMGHLPENTRNNVLQRLTEAGNPDLVRAVIDQFQEKIKRGGISDWFHQIALADKAPDFQRHLIDRIQENHSERLREALEAGGVDRAEQRENRRRLLQQLLDDYNRFEAPGDISPDVRAQIEELRRSAVAEVEGLKKHNENDHLHRIDQALESLKRLHQLPENNRRNMREFLSLTDFGNRFAEACPTLNRWLGGEPSRILDPTRRFGDTLAQVNEVAGDVNDGFGGGAIENASDVLSYIEIALRTYQIFTDDSLSHYEAAKQVTFAWVQELAGDPFLQGKLGRAGKFFQIYGAYQAFSSGNPVAIADFLVVMYFPPAMLPMLIRDVTGLTSEIVGDYVTDTVFDAALYDMFVKSAFDPMPGGEPEAWRDNESLVKYKFVSFESDADEYRGVEGVVRLLRDIREGAGVGMSTTGAAAGIGETGNGAAQDFASGASVIVTRGIDDAIAAVLNDGKHKLFRDDDSLGELSRAQAELDTLLGVFEGRSVFDLTGKGLRQVLDANFEAVDEQWWIRIDRSTDTITGPANLDPAVRRAIEKILKERKEIKQRKEQRLAHAIVHTFEEERRRIFLVANGLLEQIRAELEQIEKTLHVEGLLVGELRAVFHEAQMAAAELEAARESGQGMRAAIREANRLGEEADRWLRSYRAVRDAHLRIVNHWRKLGVLPEALLEGPDAPLCGCPVLRIDPEADARLAGIAEKAFLSIPAEIREILLVLKGGVEPGIAPGQADHERFRELASRRFLALQAEMWLRGEKGPVDPVLWKRVMEPIPDEDFADRLAAAISPNPDGLVSAVGAAISSLASIAADKAGLYETAARQKTKDHRGLAMAYNRLANNDRVQYAFEGFSAIPTGLVLYQGDDPRSIEVTPAHRKAVFSWDVNGFPENLVSVQPASGASFGFEKPGKLEIRPLDSPMEQAVTAQVNFDIHYDLEGKRGSVKVDEPLDRRLSIPLEVRPPVGFDVTIRLVQVRDGAVTSEGVSGALVAVAADDGPASGVATVAGEISAGTYLAPRLPPGDYIISVRANGFQSADGDEIVTASIDLSGLEEGAKPEPVAVPMYPRPGSITVAVTDSETGAPVPGATVSIQPAPTVGSAAIQAGASGRVEFGPLAPGDNYHVEVSHPYYQGPVAPLAALVVDTANPERSSPPVTVGITPNHAGFSVTVVDGNGEPFPGAAVTFSGMSFYAGGKPTLLTENTGADGVVTFPGIRPGDNYSVRAIAEGYAPASTGNPIPVLPTQEGVELGLPYPLQLVPGGQVTVNVVDGETGAPIPGATLFACDPGRHGGLTVNGNAVEERIDPLDDSGSKTYSHLPPGEYLFNAYAPGYPILARARSALVTTADPVRTLTIALESIMEVKVRVCDAKSGDPIGPASIFLSDGGGPEQFFLAPTGSTNGYLRVKNANPSFRVGVDGYEESITVLRKDPAEQTAPVTHSVSLEPNLTLRVDVYDHRNHLLDGASIHVLSDAYDAGVKTSSSSHEQRSVFRELAEGDYFVRVTADGFEPQQQQVTVKGGSDAARRAGHIEFHLQPRPAKIVAKVYFTELEDGDAPPEPSVTLTSPGPTFTRHGTEVAFTAFVPRSGVYRVATAAPGFSSDSDSFNGNFRLLAPDQEKSVSLFLKKNPVPRQADPAEVAKEISEKIDEGDPDAAVKMLENLSPEEKGKVIAALDEPVKTAVEQAEKAQSEAEAQKEKTVAENASTISGLLTEGDEEGLEKFLAGLTQEEKKAAFDKILEEKEVPVSESPVNPPAEGGGAGAGGVAAVTGDGTEGDGGTATEPPELPPAADGECAGVTLASIRGMIAQGSLATAARLVATCRGFDGAARLIDQLDEEEKKRLVEGGLADSLIDPVTGEAPPSEGGGDDGGGDEDGDGGAVAPDPVVIAEPPASPPEAPAADIPKPNAGDFEEFFDIPELEAFGDFPTFWSYSEWEPDRMDGEWVITDYSRFVDDPTIPGGTRVERVKPPAVGSRAAEYGEFTRETGERRVYSMEMLVMAHPAVEGTVVEAPNGRYREGHGYCQQQEPYEAKMSRKLLEIPIRTVMRRDSDGAESLRAAPHGKGQGWFDNGDPRFEVTYQSGLRQGEARVWLPGRKLLETGSYRDDLRNGTWQLFHRETGRLWKTVTYRDGILDGPCRIYDPAKEGQRLVAEGNFKQGAPQ